MDKKKYINNEKKKSLINKLKLKKKIFENIKV